MNRKKITAAGVFLLLCSLLVSCAVDIKVDSPESDGEASWGNQILVAYCPGDPAVEEMAEQIRNYAGAEIYAIEDEKKAKMDGEDKDIHAYKTLILGMPVENKQTQQKVLDFLASCDLLGKNII